MGALKDEIDRCIDQGRFATPLSDAERRQIKRILSETRNDLLNGKLSAKYRPKSPKNG